MMTMMRLRNDSTSRTDGLHTHASLTEDDHYPNRPLTWKNLSQLHLYTTYECHQFKLVSFPIYSTTPENQAQEKDGNFNTCGNTKNVFIESVDWRSKKSNIEYRKRSLPEPMSEDSKRENTATANLRMSKRRRRNAMSFTPPNEVKACDDKDIARACTKEGMRFNSIDRTSSLFNGLTLEVTQR
mmetsp:Transcript_33735/g.41362  ORF Transcript_33735/g.41362 Transcript_33735/m.41362 type:complete len:184 (-) Transcript_33735:77-628(-)